MFTGIIETVGRIQQLQKVDGDLRLQIAAPGMDMRDVRLGDSIATNGVCLTVVQLTANGFWADVSRETLAYTRLGDCAVGTAVNLEKALMPTSRLGGHIVSGHVDGVGKVLERQEDARSIRFVIAAPDALAKYLAHKGSICVDGISLTINAVEGSEFHLNIVPHTAAETTINEWRAGSHVHLEVDVIARYLERLLLGGEANQAAAKNNNGGLTLATLAASGMLKSR